ncbi:hypothetical protein HKD37_09G025090 [Glycine soja]
MDTERGFSLLEILKLKMYSLESSESPGVVLSRCLNFHASSHLTRTFALSTSLDFFVGLLCAKRELVAKQEDALGLSCALSELFQSSTFSSSFCINFLPKYLKSSSFNFC